MACAHDLPPVRLEDGREIPCAHPDCTPGVYLVVPEATGEWEPVRRALGGLSWTTLQPVLRERPFERAWADGWTWMESKNE